MSTAPASRLSNDLAYFHFFLNSVTKHVPNDASRYPFHQSCCPVYPALVFDDPRTDAYEMDEISLIFLSVDLAFDQQGVGEIVGLHSWRPFVVC